MPWTDLLLHAARPGVGPELLVVLALAGLGSAAIVGLALAAFARRRSRSYLLVALALATVLVRTIVAVWSLANPLAMSATRHHYVEHGLDVAMTALVIGAVYYARTVEAPTAGGKS